jgi:hypothetical protein
MNFRMLTVVTCYIQVTVDSTGSMPQVRYFHAAEIVNSRREIYVYGGLSQICHGDDKCTSQVCSICN